MKTFLIPKTYLFVLICSTILVSSCKKDPPVVIDPPKECYENGLPCLTTEGKNMFACKVNGVNWIADVPYNFNGPFPVYGTFNETTDRFGLQGTYKDDDANPYESIYIYSFISDGIGQYEIDVPINEQIGFSDFTGQICDYYFQQSDPGWVEIVHFDTEANIISGYFEMTLINTDCVESDTMFITDGRFDCRY